MLVSVIIPTVDGREDVLTECLAGIANQPYDTEVLIFRNRPTCGQAWVEGSYLAEGQFVWYAADDVYPEAGFFEAMIEAARADKCACATVYEPDGILQSAGIEGMDCYRPEVIDDWMPVSHTTTPFMSQQQLALLVPHFEILKQLHYCSDMLCSHILGLHGNNTVVRTKARLVHFNAAPGRGAGTDQHSRTAADRALYERYVSGL